MQIKGARCLVTGGSEGIGQAIAHTLINKGARVAIMARNETKLMATATEIGAFAVPGDVAIEEQAEGAVATVEREFGGIDLLVNNAGIGYFAPLVDLDKEQFERVFAVNVTGAMLMGRAAARRFVQKDKGCIVNISSTSGLSGGKMSSAYSSSKFALRGMTECWRAELRPHNVRVMLVNPSEVLTQFFDKVGREQKQAENKLRPSEIADAIVGALEIDDRGFIPEFSVFATNPF